VPFRHAVSPLDALCVRRSVILYGTIHLADASLHYFDVIGLHEHSLDLAVVIYLVGLVPTKLFDVGPRSQKHLKYVGSS